MKKREGWMDSIDFQHELGYALGGNIISPDKEDCERTHPCIKESAKDDGYKCVAMRVYVFDADEFDKRFPGAIQ